MVRDTFAAVFTTLPVVRHHDIVLSPLPRLMITVCIINRPLDLNASKISSSSISVLPCLVRKDLNVIQID